VKEPKIQSVRAEDIRRFAERDWERLSAEKTAWWAERSAEERLRAAELLREHMRRIRPDWPSPAERQADHEAHALLSRMLRRAGGDS